MNFKQALSTWRNMIASFPRGVASFVITVTGICLGAALLIIWIGIPILIITFSFCKWMTESTMDYAEEPRRETMTLKATLKQASDQAMRSDSWRYLLDLLSKRHTYQAVLFCLAQFPFGIVNLTLGLVLPATAFGVLLSPLTFSLNSLFFKFNFTSVDWVMAPILFWMTPFQRSWVASGLGFILVLLLPYVFKKLAQLNEWWASWCSGNRFPSFSRDAQVVSSEPFQGKIH